MLFRKVFVTCVLYLMLPNLICFPLNRLSNVKQLKRNKNVHSTEENSIDEYDTKTEIEPKNVVNCIRKTTIQYQPESSSAIYIYIDGNLDKKRTVWRWSCLGLFCSMMVLVILLKFFYYNFDLGFYYANPEKTELLPDN